MKQIIHITLGGRNIAIEDTAYKKIKEYIEQLSVYFRAEPGREEIIADIENRFSELMQDKLRKGAAHITDADVDEMINTMGRPEDFDDTATSQHGYYKSASYGSLYRDENNKMLGGVCSGIANWLNIDPTIIRVLFALMALGGFGTGVLIYILLWIFLPSKNLFGYTGKRLFRNPDNRIIGGVASGIAAYFGREPNTIRFIFSIPLILSALKAFSVFGWHDYNIFPNIVFGSLSGTFVTIYIILWIVLPEALSPYEKMEMQGQPVDLNSIKEKVQYSMGNVKTKAESWGKEVERSVQRLGTQATSFGQTRGKAFTKELGNAAGRSARGIGHAISVLFQVFFFIIFGTIIFSLFIALIAFLVSGYAFAPVNDYLWTSDHQRLLAWATILLFIAAPIVGAIVWLVRKIMNVTTPGGYLGWLFGGLWAIGWVCLTFFAGSVSDDFKRDGVKELPVTISQPQNGKLIFTVSKPELTFEGNFGWARRNGNEIEGFAFTKDSLLISDVAIHFEKSPDSFYHVSIVKHSFGKTEQEAINRASKLQYTIQQQDSIIDLSNAIGIDKSSKYRLQNVTILVDVPVGKQIEIKDALYRKLNMLDIDVNHILTRYPHRRIARTHHYAYSTDIPYTMQENGELISDTPVGRKNDLSGSIYKWEDDNTNETTIQQEDTTQLQERTGYRYNDAATPSPSATEPSLNRKDSIAKILREKQKEVEELKMKLEQ